MKKKLLKALSFVFVIMMLLQPMALAADLGGGAAVCAEQAEESDEVKIFTCFIGGIEHYRVWSLTRGIWLTDWLPMP